MTRPRVWHLVGILVPMGLAGCSLDPGFFPKGGPHQGAILEQAAASGAFPGGPRASVPYLLVEPSPQLIEALAAVDGVLATLLPGRSGGGGERVGVGDLLDVTIFEAGPGGLFTAEASATARNANNIGLPPQPVDANGEITVPYAGKVRAAGRTVAEIQGDIENKLKNRAVQPQVIVTIRENRSSQVSVLGQVNAPGQLPLLSSGTRILDAIARAGGIRVPGYETNVTLQRGPRNITVPFDSLVARPETNITLLPRDVVYVSRYARSFVAFGASGKNQRLEFDAATLSMMEAVGKAEGLLDVRANPGGVFVYRLERRDILERLGYPVQNFPGTLIPTIYSVDLNTPAAVFLASQFRMRDQDVLYVANAPAVELTKFFTLLSTISAPARDAASIYGIAQGSGVVTAISPTNTTAGGAAAGGGAAAQ